MNLLIQVRRNGHLIAEGRPDRDRRELGVPPENRAAFTLICTEDLPDGAIALGDLEATATSADGQTGKVILWDVMRAAAFMRTLSTLSLPLTSGQALLSLDWLAKNRSLPQEVVTLLRSCEDAVASRMAQRVHPLPVTRAEPLLQDAAKIEARDFWFRFESLGSNCRLGQVQRHFLAEPLGLLRFSGISIETVTRALQSDFEGTGAPENTHMRTTADGEYVTTDKRYSMFSHTHIHTGQYPQDRLYIQQCKKLTFLARNLMEKIREGSKIFVVHDMPRDIERSEIRALHDILRSKGSQHLLYIRCCTSESPAGTAYLDRDGHLVGHVLDEASVTRDAFCNSWRSACRAAVALIESEDIHLAA